MADTRGCRRSGPDPTCDKVEDELADGDIPHELATSLEIDMLEVALQRSSATRPIPRGPSQPSEGAATAPQQPPCEAFWGEGVMLVEIGRAKGRGFGVCGAGLETLVPRVRGHHRRRN